VPVNDIPKGLDCDISSQESLDYLAFLGCQLIQLAMDNKYALGVAAVQCGIPLKAFVARSQSPYCIEEKLYGIGQHLDTYSMYVNCEYSRLNSDKNVDSIEGCLSLPGKTYKVKRYPTIHLRGKLIGPSIETGEIIAMEVDMAVDNPYDSIVIQHEIQHQQGLLISDVGELYIRSL